MIPKPKAEIVLETHEDARLILVYCSSLDSRKWVADNVERFCTLFQYDSRRQCFSMFVSPLYSVKDVERYILSQGKEDNA
jgi:hypothetical protein